jgi:hypothetical protein
MSAMQPMKGLKGSKLEWIQPKRTVRHFELKSGRDLFATLTWVKPLGTLAEASTAEGHFTLKRAGFLQPYVTMRDASTGNDVAVLKMGLFRHATLELGYGKRVSMISTRFWRFEWELVDENGQKLCSVRMRPSLGRQSGDVVVFETVRRDRELAAILVICWYALVLISNESSAAGTGALPIITSSAAVYHSC